LESRIEPIAFRGIVFTGFGEGNYYVKLYRRVLRDKLGFDPYPGTLNLRAATIEDLKALERIRSLPAIEIPSFKGRGRSLGSARCYRVAVEHRVRGVMIVPERTHYGRDVAEILAAERLREKLGLKDGDIITVELTFEEDSLSKAKG
jgi:riboflavin kinase